MVEIKLDEAALARLDGAAKAAALETVEAVKTDLVSSQTMPFDTGAMQGSLHTEQFDAADESITIGDDTIYRSYERGKQARGRRVVGNPALL